VRSRGIIVTLIVLLLLLFAVLNFSSLAVNLPLNLIFFRVQAPLGLILVGFALVLSFIFLLVSLFRRAGQLRQISHLETELERERALVEKKRLSEFETLEGRLDERLNALEATVQTAVQSALAEQHSRFELSERAQLERLETQLLGIRNDLADDIGEINTAVRRSLPPATPPENGLD